MARQVALLRGINLGSRNRMGMAPLRDLMRELGYADVRTHLNSGNVLFTTEDAPEEAARRIEDRIAEHFGFRPNALVRTRDELAGVVAADPLGEVATDPARYLVAFLDAAPDPRSLDDVDPADFDPEAFRLVGREIYLWYPDGVRNARALPALRGRLGVTATTRNWTTVTRLSALADE